MGEEGESAKVGDCPEQGEEGGKGAQTPLPPLPSTCGQPFESLSVTFIKFLS